MSTVEVVYTEKIQKHFSHFQPHSYIKLVSFILVTSVVFFLSLENIRKWFVMTSLAQYGISLLEEILSYVK